MSESEKKIGVTELVLRDGHQSLIATRLQTEDMLPICERLNRVGFWSLEVWGGATFDSCVRFLREDPWKRLRKLRRAIPDTRLQMLLRGQNLVGYRHYADDVVAAFVKQSAKCGMDVFRIFDALNDFRNMKSAIRAVKESKRHAQGTICYTTSPAHTIEGFVALAKQLADAGCDSIAIKDMAGIMTPNACGNLVSAIKKEVALPLHVHSHYTSGLAAMCLMRAAESGADVIDTAISSFAEGASHPATETMAAALNLGLDMNLLGEIAAYFQHVRKKYWQFESEYTGVDPRVLEHHVPGGMISNLSNQLREQGALDKMNSVLEEIPKVRRDLGYPPLVTPASQIVATQAVLNVLLGERYKSVTKEVKNYLLGFYGEAPGEIDSEVRKKAVGDSQKKEKGAIQLGDEMERLQSESDSFARGDEDVLTYAMFPDLGKVFLQERAAGQLKPESLLPPPPPASEESPKIESAAPSEFRITVHGETYHIRVTGVGHRGAEQRPFYVTVDGVPEEVLVETLEEVPTDSAAEKKSAVRSGGGGGRPRASKPGQVTTAMPGTVVEVLVSQGQEVKSGDPVLVVEAMKMESEIQAPIDGTVVGVLVAKGDAVTPDEVLIEIGH